MQAERLGAGTELHVQSEAETQEERVSCSPKNQCNSIVKIIKHLSANGKPS